MRGTPKDEKLRCVSCGEVIGAYERLVALRDGRARSTSKAAETDSGGQLGECYHHACYTSRHGEPDE
jgi:hypothetical protein